MKKFNTFFFVFAFFQLLGQADFLNVTNSGKVGIGTSNPQVPLHIVNPFPGTDAIRIQGENTWISFFDGPNYDGFFWNNYGNISVGTSNVNSFGSFIFYSQGAERMRISSSGLVGIGITVPTYKLHVVEGNGVAIYGRSTNNSGLVGHSDVNIGVLGSSNGAGAAGVYGVSPFIGVQGIVSSGSTNPSRQGIRGDNSGSTTGFAGYFFGSVGVSGALTKGAGAFKIDHPLDPEHKYLYHSFVESPDMKNIYDGIVTTDERGIAEIFMPDWFEALNRDFRYQLTIIGEFAQAIVSRKMSNNSFQIKTNQPNVEVSWQVTGIRKDAYAEQNRIPLEENKPADKMGRYIHPEAFGKTVEMAIDYIPPKDQKVN